MKKLYIGNLPWSIDNSKLTDLFNKYSSLTSANVIMDNQTGRSRGFGFVELSDDSEAEKAISEMNEVVVEDRKLVVNEAKPRENNL